MVIENTLATESHLAAGGTGHVASRRSLLVVDGDSFAHRAYHALPKTTQTASKRPAGAIVGFLGMISRLWLAERPRALAVGWDTLTEPTARHRDYPGYQAGRVFDDAIVEQLDLLPGLLAEGGIVVGKHAGYEADDFLAAAVVREESEGGTTLVATSDRDAFQLASSRTTILQPARGVSELQRVGQAEVVQRYGVLPEQVPDFIALRGDPSDGIPGARGVGEKTAARLLAEYGSLETLLEAGRFSAEADLLRLFKRIATMDAGAPLPPSPDHQPSWKAIAEAVGTLGLDGLARRLAGVV